MACHKRHVARVWVGCGWRTEVSRTEKQFFVGGQLSFFLPNTWTAHCRVSLTVPGPWIVMPLEQCRLLGDVPAREAGMWTKVRAQVRAQESYKSLTKKIERTKNQPQT